MLFVIAGVLVVVVDSRIIESVAKLVVRIVVVTFVQVVDTESS